MSFARRGMHMGMTNDDTAPEAGSREQRWSRLLEWPLFAAALLVIPVVILSSGRFGAGWERVGLVLNWATWLAFAAEIAIMMIVTEHPRRWLREHPIELAVTILSPPVLPGPLQTVRFVRVLRLTRLLMTVKMLRRLVTSEGMLDATLLTGFLVLAGGVAFSQVERSQHLSAWDGVWWATSTITTVGYGDVTPHTTAGRLIGITIMLAGIGFVALLTAAVAQRFILGEERSSEAMEGLLDEILTELRDIRERLDELDGSRNGGRRSAAARRAR